MRWELMLLSVTRQEGDALLADFAIAFVMTTVIYLAFDRLLTLSLPAGPLERLL